MSGTLLECKHPYFHQQGISQYALSIKYLPQTEFSRFSANLNYGSATLSATVDFPTTFNCNLHCDETMEGNDGCSSGGCHYECASGPSGSWDWKDSCGGDPWFAKVQQSFASQGVQCGTPTVTSFTPPQPVIE
jgi:hypothetical protein